MVKLLENTYRSVNIGLVNEIALMCHRLNLDVWEVIDGAATKPFGFMRFYPGPGIGGHCIPLDPHYLSWKLKTLNYSARFIELASEINANMPLVVTRKATELLNAEKKAVNGARILVLGVAYKRDVGDTRESPALEVMRLLAEGDADVSYADPFVDTLSLDGRLYAALEVTPELLADVDCVVVTTDHTGFPWDAVAEHARLIVDARGAVRRRAVQHTLWPLSGPAVLGPRAAGAQTDRVFQVPRENQ